ncbi:MAG: TIGR01212 family radical SAM protein [Ruminococcus sp.]|nr:TIGR01212 family radical SAM protein [Ruminococcus sp.]
MTKMNPFKYSDTNKRYHTLNYYNKVKYGEKVFKAVIDGGFTCPNKDGKISHGGCIFCDGGSGYFTKGNLSVKEQVYSELKRIRNKNPNAKAIAYFQSNTNTYASVEYLKKVYEEALSCDGIIGISIGTRADCLDQDIINYIADLNNQTNLTVELGLQTIHNTTLKYINRGYNHEKFCDGYNKLKERNIRTCLHIINGLPFENEKMMLDTVQEVAKLNPEAVKIQMLHVIKNTPLEKTYNNGLELLSMEEYIDIVVKQLELLSPETVVERITGDGDKSKLISPLWSTNKIAVLGGIDKKQVQLNSMQGKKYEL